MAWEFLRRMFGFVGGKIMGRLAPRLLFFQYSNIVTHELDEKNRRYRFYQVRTAAEMEILRLRMRRPSQPEVGLSTVKQDRSGSRSEASVFEVEDGHDFSDTATVFSSYQNDERETFQFIELDRSIVQDI